MENLIDSIISISTNKINERKINSFFIYNKYSNDETTNKDDIIVNNLKTNKNQIKNKFIRLNISFLSSFKDLDLDEFTENIPEIYNISEFANLDASDLLYFNRQSNYNNKRSYHITGLDRQETSKAIEYLTSNEDIPSLDTSKIKTNLLSTSKISILKDDDLNLELLYNNKVFSDSKVFSDNNFNDEFNSNVSQLDRIKEGFIFNTFKPFKSVINNENMLTFSLKNGVRCGFLLEKYKLIRNEFIKVASRFFTKKRSESNLENLASLIEDEAIQYGQTYKYVLSDVYLYAYPDEQNRFMLNYYLLCDNPCISDDIECRENEKPPPPLNIKFSYNKELKELKIKWQEPTNYQYDAKGYQILKRHKIEEPFTVIKQLEGHYRHDDYRFREIVDSESKIFTEGIIPYEFIDKSYEPGRITIYAIRTIDAHGFISDYSEQIAILYDPFEEDLIVDLISSKGASRDYPNEKIKNISIFFKNKIDIVDNLPVLKNPSKISLYITPEFGGYSQASRNIKIIDDKYQFTITKLNDMSIYKEKFNITNFNLS